ncbi:hypothetical protein [Sanguibacter antarcticus]|uniref:Lipoprotein n=1 Tax=Sanguibacter antarcticus TaxID=372484 RepID=A0A2A9E780_9MICO|nr:hypothetical protein [Sanguibacter antarcticus]PFG34917.1 hypothetical protein ATL42_2848 [Sanguibacter antarcticus]
MQHGAHTTAALVAAALLTVTSTSCAPPDERPHPPQRAHHGALRERPPVTDAFPDGTAQSAVEFWHDNPELMPSELDGSTLLIDAAGSGASSISLPAGPGHESLALVLTCARPIAYTISLVAAETDEALTATDGASCGGPTIAVFTTPPLHLASATASIDVDIDVPSSTSYFLAVYGTARTVGERVLP